MKFLSIIWDELTLSNSYKNDWYGYAKNQLSHIMLGLIWCFTVSAIYWSTYGEFADKAALWIFIAATYIAFELGSQEWRGWDTIEDWMFFAVYGGGIPVVVFTEVEVGSPILNMSIEWVLPTTGVIVAHLLTGVAVRIVNEVRNGRD